MKLFDLHCDTITELEKNSSSLYQNDLNISLQKADFLQNYTQVFAIFIPDSLRKNAAVDYFDKVSYFYNEQILKNNSIISPYFDNKNTRFKAILSVEGGAAANGSLEGLHHLYASGVRLLTLTWNGQNEIGSGCFDANDTGLTTFGKRLIKEMESLSMIIDVSHLSKKGFFDVADLCSKPFIASHSNPDIVNNYAAKKRNLSDEQVLCLIEHKGLIGLNFCKNFLLDDDSCPFEAVYKHISHLLDLGAKDIIAIGSDFDGCTLPYEFNNIEKIQSIYEFLISKNLDKTLCDNIFYNNAQSFFDDFFSK